MQTSTSLYKSSLEVPIMFSDFYRTGGVCDPIVDLKVKKWFLCGSYHIVVVNKQRLDIELSYMYKRASQRHGTTNMFVEAHCTRETRLKRLVNTQELEMNR